MSRKILYGLIVLIILILVLIFNQGEVNVSVLFTTLQLQKSLVFLVFACVGGLIGVLLNK